MRSRLKSDVKRHLGDLGISQQVDCEKPKGRPQALLAETIGTFRLKSCTGLNKKRIIFTI